MKYGELTHPNHPQHPLRFDPSALPFRCDGCLQVGLGSRFRCPLCDFDLHTHCSSPSSPLRHPFFPKCLFHFLPIPPSDSPRSCDACSRPAPKFLFHCRACGFDLHPCCASLPHALRADPDILLRLRRRASGPCHRCGRKGRGWSYRSECGKYELHVGCVTEMLVESWYEIYYGAPGGGKVVIPKITGAGKCHHGKGNGNGKGKVKRCCEVAGLAVQFVVSAVLGDPTAAVAGVVSSLLFR